MLFIGIDLGTSSLKIVVSDTFGNILHTEQEKYDIEFPQPGYAQQNPQDWYQACIRGLKNIFRSPDIKKEEIAGISFGGQMHGLVILDKDDQVIRPAILWNDTRSASECDYLHVHVGKKALVSYCGNIAFPGFTAPKLLWLQKYEPDNFKKIVKIMLPKDYLVYRLSGEFCSDVSDASGTLLFDVKNRVWSKEMMAICKIRQEQLPKVFESYEVVGTLLPALANQLQISHQVKIIAGAGDNAAAAIGMGITKKDQCSISIGTSGTLFLPMQQFPTTVPHSLHVFCDASGHYHAMGCMLSAASSYTWWLENIIHRKDYLEMQNEITQANEGSIFFLPYLMGERSPMNDPNATGCFIGLRLDTTSAQMSKAVLEGIAFALRDLYEEANHLESKTKKIYVCGGGAKNGVLLEVLANVLQSTLHLVDKEVGPGYGACILAMVGCGVYENIEDACSHQSMPEHLILPNEETRRLYEKKYTIFKQLYPALKPIFAKMKQGD